MWAATAIVAVSTAYTAYEKKEARKDAEEDAKKAEEEARRAEVFAETTGKGKGELGQISLALDDELDEEEQENVSSSLKI